MRDDALYRELGILTNDRDRWSERIPYVSSLLSHGSVRIRAKALWLLGEMGLRYPTQVQSTVPAIASFLDSPTPILRERAVNALGRIGRGSFPVIEPYWISLFRFASDADAGVRLSFVWASENIAVNSPDVYAEHLPTFACVSSVDSSESGSWSRIPAAADLTYLIKTLPAIRCRSTYEV